MPARAAPLRGQTDVRDERPFLEYESGIHMESPTRRVLVSRWSPHVLRWLPPIALTTLVAGLSLVSPLRRSFFYYAGSSSVSALVVLVAWAVIAWSVAIRAHQQFVRTLRSATLTHVLIVGCLVGLLLILRSRVSLASIPLLCLIVHLGAAGEPVRLRIAAGVLMAILTSVLAEGVLAASLWIPALWNVPGFNVVAFNRYWWDVNVIQLNPACAQSDPELAYILRPGTCTFSNPGYRNEYRINRLGVRDDEESLDRPVIVAIGDSHTMGMGVEEHETYAAQLERLTGLKTLNTGVSSYGTARELMLLHRVDRDAARYVLLQFCSNDFEENRAFLANGTLPRRTRDWFDTQVEDDQARRRYYAGKFMDFSLLAIRRGLVRRISTEPQEPQQDGSGPSKQFLEDLLNVIDRDAADLTTTEVLVFEMDFLPDYRKENAADLQQLLVDYQARGRLRNVRVVDVMKDLGPEYFIPLDGHMNALGHRRVAERLAAAIQQ